MKAQFTLLGSGTSTGVPVIGCACAVCGSSHPHNQRTRSGAWIQYPQGSVTRSILVDASPDLRQQLLREDVSRVDALLFTHAHADHIFGLDDIRIYNFRQRAAIPVFGSAETLGRIKTAFSYVFEDTQEGGGKPSLELCPIDGPFELFGAQVEPIPVLHGELEVLGYRFGELAYITDCKAVPERSFTRIQSARKLVLGALRYKPHPTHLSLGEALQLVDQLGSEQAWFTHLAHDVDASHVEVELPSGCALGYDGLSFTFDWLQESS